MANEILSHDEKRLRESLEDVVDKGLGSFIEVGQSLAKLRDKRLYRDECKTFEEYCQQRFKLVRRQVDRIISASEVATDVENETHGSQNDAHGHQKTGQPDVLPTIPNERVARELVKVPKPERAKIWKKAVESSKTKDGPVKVTAKAVKRIVEESEPEHVDELGRALPKELEAPFSVRDDLDRCLNILRELVTIINPLIGDPQNNKKPAAGGEYLAQERQELLRCIKQTRAFIDFARPYAPCPYPHAGRCTACHGLGYVPKLTYERAPKELRK